MLCAVEFSVVCAAFMPDSAILETELMRITMIKLTILI